MHFICYNMQIPSLSIRYQKHHAEFLSFLCVWLCILKMMCVHTQYIYTCMYTYIYVHICI